MTSTRTTQPTAVYARRTQHLGWMKIYAEVNEDTAIMIAARTCPAGFVTDTGAEKSADYGCWIVPVYRPLP